MEARPRTAWRPGDARVGNPGAVAANLTLDDLKIIHPEYGSANRWADLTAVLIQTGKPSPLAQHRRKFTALAPNGQISAEVSGFGDSFRIFYGARGRRNNVEGSLIQAIRADRLNLLMNSANMGGDPFPARSKELLVRYF